MLPTVHRLRHRSDFSAVMRARSRASVGSLVVHLNSSSAAPPRLGLVIPKSVGGSVVRHRVARQLRAIAAARIQEWPAGTDIVLRALPSAADADSASLAVDLDRALKRLGVGRS